MLFAETARRKLTRIPPYVSLCLSLLLTAFATLYTFQLRNAEERQNFERLENRLLILLQSRIQIYLNSLNSTRGLFFVHGLPTRLEFKSFVDGMGLTERYPGIMGVGWAARVHSGEVPGHILHTRISRPTYRIWPQSPDLSEEVVPVVYLEPEDRSSQRVIGFNLHSEPSRRSAMERARDSGDAVITDRLRLMTSGGPGKGEEMGFLLFLPVYQGGDVPITLEQRRSDILGYIFAPFRVSDFFSIVTDELNEHGQFAKFEVYDGTSVDPARLLYDSRPPSGGRSGPFSQTLTLTLGHHNWTVRFSSLPDLLSSEYSRSPAYVLLVGLLISVFIYSFTRSLKSHNDRIAASEAQLQVITDTLPALVSYVDRGLRFVVVNRMYEDLFGLPVSEIVGHPIQDLLTKEAYDSSLDYIQKVFRGESVAFEQKLRFNRLGWRMMRTNFIPDRDPDGDIRGMVILSLDVTEVRKAESQLRENEAAARRSADERAFLAEASQILSSSLDYNTILKSVTQLAVPRLADWACIHIESSKGHFELAAIAHHDSSRQSWAHEISKRFPTRRGDSSGMAKVFETGEPYLNSSVEDSRLQELAHNSEHYDALKQTECASAMCVPLKVRGHTFGTLSFVASVPGRYTQRELDLAVDLGRRVSVAVDNAKLYLESQNVNRIKDEFLATLSHELRTPLNVIQGHAEILRQEVDVSPDILESVDAIYRNCQLQSQIVNDLLDVSAIITGKVSFHPTALTLNDLLDSTVESMRFTAEAKGLRLTLKPSDQIVCISGDPLRLQQVFWNLLSNAVKFTPRGGRIEVELKAEGSQCEVVVRDTGQGIDPHFIPYVFERFRQEDSSMTRRYGGLGLGLSIVRHLVELHGGEVSVVSCGRNQGSEFLVRLPVSSIETRLHARRGIASSPSSPTASV